MERDTLIDYHEESMSVKRQRWADSVGRRQRPRHISLCEADENNPSWHNAIRLYEEDR